MQTPRQVLVLNCGSSSLRFAVIDPATGEESLAGIGDALGQPEPTVSWTVKGDKQTAPLPKSASHAEVVRYLVDEILSTRRELLQHLVALGHRVVHGGEQFSCSALVDDSVIHAIRQCAALAPLHNPAALQGIAAAREAFPELPQVAVFDTAFHQSMPRHAYIYALPYSLYREYGIRRYGMHGTSHRYVTERSAELLNLPVDRLNIISAHLGNGASITAVRDGCSIDTSMGLTPLEGLVMGTRCGDMDPGIIMHLGCRFDYSLKQLSDLLNRESGLLGISELSNDCRALEQAAADGHEGARLALEIFSYRLAKYVAAYHAPVRQVDAVVFTGGIGENSSLIREKVLTHLEGLGFRTDPEKNRQMRFGAEGAITTSDSALALVVPTNEEWIIARDAASLIPGECLSHNGCNRE